MAFPVFYVNRNPNNRKRHLDRNCRYLQLARDVLTRMHEDGVYDDFQAREGRRPPTIRTRFRRVQPRTHAELTALEAFTTPCVGCVPGARALMADLPIDFEGH